MKSHCFCRHPEKRSDEGSGSVNGEQQILRYAQDDNKRQIVRSAQDDDNSVAQDDKVN